jgi:hypothetical protein
VLEPIDQTTKRPEAPWHSQGTPMKRSLDCGGRLHPCTAIHGAVLVVDNLRFDQIVGRAAQDVAQCDQRIQAQLLRRLRHEPVDLFCSPLASRHETIW